MNFKNLIFEVQSSFQARHPGKRNVSLLGWKMKWLLAMFLVILKTERNEKSI